MIKCIKGKKLNKESQIRQIFIYSFKEYKQTTIQKNKIMIILGFNKLLKEKQNGNFCLKIKLDLLLLIMLIQQ